MLKPVCVKCRRFYRPIKNGFYFVEGMPTVNHAPKGTEAPELWRPYKLWAGDLFECEGCGSQIVSGTGVRPFAEHWEADFNDTVAKMGAEVQINDC